MKNINEEEIVVPYQYFYDLEKEMGLFALTYKNIHYWQLVRVEILKQITRSKMECITKLNKRNYLDEIVGAIVQATRMLFASCTYKAADIVRIRPCVTVNQDHELDDHQFDYFNFEKKWNVVDVYALGIYNHVDKCVKYSMAIAEVQVVFWKIKRKIKSRICQEKPFDSQQVEKLGEFIGKVNKIYGSDIKLYDVMQEIQFNVYNHMVYKKQFKKIFKKMKPRVIIEYPHYDIHMFAANMAAKECGIKSVEIQHGQINAHESYWYEDINELGKALPDYFFVYGKWWKEQIKLPQCCKVVVTGNAYLEKQVQKYQNNESGCIISFFSNIYTGIYLVELIKKIYNNSKNKNLKIIFKLHPDEFENWKQNYPFLVQHEDIKVIKNEQSVYQIFSYSKVIVGITSTVFFEALAYQRKKILIYKKGNYVSMLPLLKSGDVTGFETVDDFWKCISECSDREGTRLELWEDDACSNIVRYIERILTEE